MVTGMASTLATIPSPHTFKTNSTEVGEKEDPGGISKKICLGRLAVQMPHTEELQFLKEKRNVHFPNCKLVDHFLIFLPVLLQKVTWNKQVLSFPHAYLCSYRNFTMTAYAVKATPPTILL